MDDTTIPPKRIRPPKTDTQKKAAAAASAPNREKNRAVGVPSAAEIDTAITMSIIVGINCPKGVRLPYGSAPRLIEGTCRVMKWDHGNKSLREAMERRIEGLRDRWIALFIEKTPMAEGTRSLLIQPPQV